MFLYSLNRRANYKKGGYFMSNEEKILQMLGQVMESQSRMEGDIAGLKEDVSDRKSVV